MLTWIIAFGMLLGSVDCIRGNRWGLGEKFEEGFLCLGAAALNMVGIICIAPFIGTLLKPIVVPVYQFMGADPAMFGSLFANNMGGYPLAISLAENERVGMFSGLIVSSMLGASIVYTIPMGMGLIPKEFHRFFSKGVMLGIIPIPVGSFLGGLLMGLPIGILIRNTIPIIMVAVFLVVGFLCFQDQLLKGFLIFAKGIKWISTGALGAAAFAYMTGVQLIPGMADISEGMKVIVDMGVVQLGSLPVAALFIRLFRKPLEKMGEMVQVNAVSMASILISCVNVISTFTLVKEMNPKGIVIASAWFTSAIAMFTAHLSYTISVDRGMVEPVIVAKLVSGFLGIALALLSEQKKIR